MAIMVNFAALRNQRYALSHDWILEIDEAAIATVLQAHPVWGSSKAASLIESVKKSRSNDSATMQGLLGLFCKTSTIPKSTIKTETVKVYGIPTTVTLEDNLTGTITLTFLEDEEHSLYRFFSVWKDLGASRKTYAINQRGTILGTENSSLDVHLKLAPQANGKTSGLHFALIGAQPIDLELGQVTAEAGFMQLQVKMKYDNYEVE